MTKVYHLNREARRKAGKGIKLPKKNNTFLSVEELREISREADSLVNVDYSDLIYPIIVVFEPPVDFPDDIIARVFNIDNPTDIFVKYETVEDAREDARKAGFQRLIPRSPLDSPYILESYI